MLIKKKTIDKDKQPQDINILVIGGAGFIGSHIVEELVKKNYNVTVFDNLCRGKLENIQHLIDSNKIKYIKGDIRDGIDIINSTKDMDYVFHEASDCINKSKKFPKESIAINILGSVNVFEAVLKNNVKRLIYASSASVYGEPKRLPMKETDELNPITPYCISKRTCENLLKFYSTKGLRYNILRYFNVYGKRQNTDAYYTNVIILFIKRLLNNEPPIIEGDGTQSMDFVNVKDVVQANILALESEFENQIFNVGTGTQTTIKQLAEILIKSLKLDIKAEFNPRKVLVSKREADISKIKNQLGYRVTVNAKQGLAEVSRDITEHPEFY